MLRKVVQSGRSRDIRVVTDHERFTEITFPIVRLSENTWLLFDMYLD